ncbi:MAG: hypothetical protein ACE37F_22215 [Nannocystaceae bacterium]|nr:hypothetical protein [bacterium]
MRSHAYMVPAESYRELEAQILEQLREGDRDQLRHLVGEYDLQVELLSGEWRMLMSEFEDHYQVIDPDRRLARMVVSPDELEEFVDGLRDATRQARWAPISFGIAELTDALPAGTDLVAVLFLEEDDDWLWNEPVYEVIAIRPEVFALLEDSFRRQLETGDYRAMARLASDHSEGSVEFSPEQWRVLMRHAEERVPEFLTVVEQRISTPVDYTQIREALSLVADPRYQPSLDAWLRVHAASAQYALYFRDAALERRELEGSGLFSLDARSTQKMMRVPGPGGVAPEGDAVQAPLDGGETVPLSVAQRVAPQKTPPED